mgnify:CR=1 FL=1
MLFLLLLFLFSYSLALEVFSESLERLPDGTIKAVGNVEAYYKNYYIKADLMTYDPERKLVQAEGNVYIRSYDGRLEVRGESAFLDLDKDKGYFIKADGRFEKFYFTAERVDKEGNSYEVREGSITTCPPDRKELLVCFSKAYISERYATGLGSSLRLFKIPVAYTPLVVFPVGDRRSGLLPPTIGSNSYNTFIYKQPIYWAISRDKDATLTLDYRDKQAKGISLEYRQSLRKELDLTGTFSLYREPVPPGKWWEGRSKETFRENRYRLKFDLDLSELKLGVDTLSDPYFMQDVYFTTRERTIPYLTSYLSYKKEFDWVLFVFDARRFYDTTSPDNKKTLQRLPEVGLYVKDISLPYGFSFNTTFSYANFYREEGQKAQRLLLFPELSLSKRLFGLNLLSTLTLENLFYWDVKGSEATDKSVPISLRYRERLPFFFTHRVGGFQLSHMLELSYSYRPKGFKNPRFDTFDQIDKESTLNYSFLSSGYYEGKQIYSLFIQGGYNYLGSFTYLDQVVKEKLMPVRTLFSLMPADWFSLSADSTYDPIHGRLLKNVGSSTFKYKQSSLTLSRTYEKSYYGQSINDQYGAVLSTTLSNATLNLGIIRDNRIGKDLQRRIELLYKGACWAFGLLLRDNYDGTRQKYIKEVFLTFNVFDLQRLTVPLKR